MSENDNYDDIVNRLQSMSDYLEQDTHQFDPVIAYSTLSDLLLDAELEMAELDIGDEELCSYFDRIQGMIYNKTDTHFIIKEIEVLLTAWRYYYERKNGPKY